MTDHPWLGAAARAFREGNAPRLAALSTDQLDAELHRLVDEQVEHTDDECLVLYAGTNVPNPRLAALASSTIGSRPNLGHPGAKHNRGMVAAEQLELLAQEAMCRLFGCRYAELRVASTPYEPAHGHQRRISRRCMCRKHSREVRPRTVCYFLLSVFHAEDWLA